MGVRSLNVMKRAPSVEQALGRALTGARLGRPCYAFHELPSTMDMAHQLALQGASEGTCVWAETQRAGRGRAGRTWVSPRGGLYLSVVLKPSRAGEELPQLALVAGLAVAQAIHELTKLSPTIRWPNDVLLGDRKLAGILTEAKTGTRGRPHVIVGIGINVSTPRADLPEVATTLAEAVKELPDRCVLAAALLRQLDAWYRRWTSDGFLGIRPELSRWLGLHGQLVQITASHETFQGQATGLDESGRLLVRLDSGIVRPVELGEVTLLR